MRVLPLVLVAALAGRASAGDNLVWGDPEIDPPTLTALGIHVPATGDDNHNAKIEIRFKEASSAVNWQAALPLMRIHSEAVTGLTVEPGFAGSIFDLRPGTTYDIEVHIFDPDGGDRTMMIQGTTRALPGLPTTPHVVDVISAAELTTALANATPGDVITLAPGLYTGSFAIMASGTPNLPIVIRGVAEETAVLDGNGCAACNVLEVYGNYVQVENLTIRHANRALRFQGTGAHNNVVRHVHIKDVTLGIGSRPDQTAFYIADNILEGRLDWPCVYASDDVGCNGNPVVHGAHANDDGIHVEGEAHVIAFNRISGFGDAMKTEQDGVRSIDFYNNDVLWTYDNGVELDGSMRNTRAMRNRFTNTYATMSFQPIFGGPVYAIRNVIVNVADEQFKLHARGTTPTVGAVIFHNTVIRATRALQCATSASPLYFTAENNLFVGPATLADGYAVRWDVPGISTATVDFNAYFPDGQFELGYTAAMGGMTFPSFGDMLQGQRETHGQLVASSTFLDGMVGPADWHPRLDPRTGELGGFSMAMGTATPLPGVNLDQFSADIGAVQSGCAPEHYGPRAEGEDESNQAYCGTGGSLGGEDHGPFPDDFPPDQIPHNGGCCDTGGAPGGSALLALAVLGLLRWRRRRGSIAPWIA